MNDLSQEMPCPQGSKKRLTRKGFLTGILATTTLVLTGCKPVPPSSPPAEQPRETPESLQQKMIKLIQAGREMRTSSDTKMLDDTYPGIDLTYSGNETVANIRKIQDPVTRVMAAVGFLDVENSKRYKRKDDNNVDIFACNIYTLDLLRLLLGNENIGSRYDANGVLSVAGTNDLNGFSKEKMDQYDTEHPFLTADNFDWWMKKYGSDYGWRQMREDTDLQTVMNSRQSVVVGVTCEEDVQPPPNSTGHMFVLLPVNPGFVGVTQSTQNISLQVFPYINKEPKIHTTNQYNFHAHVLR